MYNKSQENKGNSKPKTLYVNTICRYVDSCHLVVDKFYCLELMIAISPLAIVWILFEMLSAHVQILGRN